jgi:hypothetical protein
MSRRHDVNIVAAPILESHHHIGETFKAAGIASTALADLPIDAENTPQSTMGEKYRTLAAHSHEGSLLSEMRVISRNLQLRSCPAEPSLTFQSIDAAFPRAEPAAFHYSPEMLTSPFQFATLLELQISRFKIRIDFGIRFGLKKVLVVLR